MNSTGISWEDLFTRPKSEGLYGGVFAFPGEQPRVFGGKVEQGLHLSRGVPRFLLFPFSEKEPYPGIDLPLQEETDLESLSENWEMKDAWESSMPCHSVSAEEYIDMVQDTLSVFGGSFKKAMLCRRWKVPNHGFFPIYAWKALRNAFPNTFTWLVTCPVAGTWIGASPELLLEQQGAKAQSWSLAGTRHRSQASGWTKKEMEEQDLVTRHIRASMSSFGLKNMLEIGPEETTMGNLQHLATRLSGTLPEADTETGLRLARLMHPTPAIGGTPTEAALNFIQEKEKQNRGYYAGFMGLLEPEALRLRLYVNLRCASLGPEAHWIFAGAGITKLSSPEAEAQETERKADLIRPFLTLRPQG